MHNTEKKLNRQRALGAFGLTKAVIHRGKRTAVSIPAAVELVSKFAVGCGNCGKRFKNNQGLGFHKLACGKENANGNLETTHPIYNSTDNVEDKIR